MSVFILMEERALGVQLISVTVTSAATTGHKSFCALPRTGHFVLKHTCRVHVKLQE